MAYTSIEKRSRADQLVRQCQIRHILRCIAKNPDDRATFDRCFPGWADDPIAVALIKSDDVKATEANSEPV